MRKFLRRIRGAIGIGLAWAVAWFGAGMVLLLIVGPDAADVPFPLFFGLLGFLAGATFSFIVGMLGRRRRFTELSLSRFAAWGAAGGVLLSGALFVVQGSAGDLLVIGPVFGAAGAISAAGTLALARRAERGDALEGGASGGGSLAAKGVTRRGLGEGEGDAGVDGRGERDSD